MQSETITAAFARDRSDPEARGRRTAPGLRDPRFWVGAVLLAVILAVGALGSRFAPYNPHALTGQPLEHPGVGHLLGTNDIGQDVFSQLLWGGSASLLVGTGAATIATAIAWILGLLSGLGRRWHGVTGGLADLFLALPTLPAIILVIAHLGARSGAVVITLGLVSWPAFARVMRARVTAELTAGYIEAARAMSSMCSQWACR